LKGCTGGVPGEKVYLKGRRSVRRRLAILFATALLSVFGAAACGAGVEEQVEQQVQEGQEQVEQQVQEGQEQVEQQVEQQMQEATERIEQQADEVRQGIEQEAQDAQKQIEGNAGEEK
jgi:uncharacterized protein HemX